MSDTEFGKEMRKISHRDYEEKYLGGDTREKRTQTASIVCPTCKGEKQNYHIILPTYLSGWKPCKTCDATGAITEEKQAILEIGASIRAKRRELHLSPADFAEEFSFTRDEWHKVEAGECTLEESYHARNIIEGLSVQFVDKFDVYFYETISHYSNVATVDTKEAAESKVNEIRANLRAIGAGGYCKIVERKERVIL